MAWLGEQTALAQAAETGEPVEITAARTEYATTEANPDGSFTLTQSTAPRRVRASDGSWQSVDTTLVHRSDGSVGPKAAVVDLAFTEPIPTCWPRMSVGRLCNAM